MDVTGAGPEDDAAALNGFAGSGRLVSREASRCWGSPCPGAVLRPRCWSGKKKMRALLQGPAYHTVRISGGTDNAPVPAAEGFERRRGVDAGDGRDLFFGVTQGCVERCPGGIDARWRRRVGEVAAGCHVRNEHVLPGLARGSQRPRP